MLSNVQMLEVQFNDFRLEFVGIQEGRSRSMQVRSGIFYDMYVASADKNGSHGVQLWVKREGPWHVT